MPLKINLLPESFAVKGSFARMLIIIKQATLVLLGLFILGVLGISGYFLISSIELGNLTRNIDQLKVQITEAQTVETQVVLLKDRIGKIKTVQQLASAQKTFENIGIVVSAVPQGSRLGELSFDAHKSDASVVFDSTLSLGDFFSNLATLPNFSSIILTSFGFNPATGYLASLRFIGK